MHDSDLSVAYLDSDLLSDRPTYIRLLIICIFFEKPINYLHSIRLLTNEDVIDDERGGGEEVGRSKKITRQPCMLI
jgi:hypothetical protein